jgi:glycosyltransferase involved in cell wall biosynthesis
MHHLEGKKVLFVITKSNWGGAQVYVYTLATNLKKQGVEVVVALGGTGKKSATQGLLAERLTETGVRTIFIQSLTRDVSVFREFRVLNELIRIIKVERPNVLHLNSSKAGGMGALAGRLCGVHNIIFTAHGWAFRERRSPIARALIWLASWATVLLSHNVIVVSKKDYGDAPVLFSRRKISMIHNGIGMPLQLGSGEIIRKAFPAGAHITGTIGELNKNKNQIALIEEARKNPLMFVAIVGEGETRAMLEAKIREYGLSDRVKLFGFSPARDVLKGFDEFALPSLKEGLPYVLLEARAAGLPIRANRVGGVSEILDASDLTQFSLEQMLIKTFALYR